MAWENLGGNAKMKLEQVGEDFWDSKLHIKMKGEDGAHMVLNPDGEVIFSRTSDGEVKIDKTYNPATGGYEEK